MEADRKQWNLGQQALRQALSRPGDARGALDLFLRQHAMVHAAAVSGAGLWSFEDQVWQGVTPPAARRAPGAEEHSLVWLAWHMARIEDVTMNILLAGQPELYAHDGWLERVGGGARDTGNLSDAAAAARLSAALDPDEVRAYRRAVGSRTREIVRRLTETDLRRRVAPARLERLLEVGAVIPAASDLIAYWAGLTGAGLLLMPPTRHNFVHLNESMRVKKRLARSVGSL